MKYTTSNAHLFDMEEDAAEKSSAAAMAVQTFHDISLGKNLGGPGLGNHLTTQGLGFCICVNWHGNMLIKQCVRVDASLTEAYYKPGGGATRVNAAAGPFRRKVDDVFSKGSSENEKERDIRRVESEQKRRSRKKGAKRAKTTHTGASVRDSKRIVERDFLPLRLNRARFPTYFVASGPHPYLEYLTGPNRFGSKDDIMCTYPILYNRAKVSNVEGRYHLEILGQSQRDTRVTAFNRAHLVQVQERLCKTLKTSPYYDFLVQDSERERAMERKSASGSEEEDYDEDDDDDDDVSVPSTLVTQFQNELFHGLTCGTMYKYENTRAIDKNMIAVKEELEAGMAKHGVECLAKPNENGFAEQSMTAQSSFWTHLNAELFFTLNYMALHATHLYPAELGFYRCIITPSDKITEEWGEVVENGSEVWTRMWEILGESPSRIVHWDSPSKSDVVMKSPFVPESFVPDGMMASVLDLMNAITLCISKTMVRLPSFNHPGLVAHLQLKYLEPIYDWLGRLVVKLKNSDIWVKKDIWRANLKREAERSTKKRFGSHLAALQHRKSVESVLKCIAVWEMSIGLICRLPNAFMKAFTVSRVINEFCVDNLPHFDDMQLAVYETFMEKGIRPEDPEEILQIARKRAKSMRLSEDLFQAAYKCAMQHGTDADMALSLLYQPFDVETVYVTLASIQECPVAMMRPPMEFLMSIFAERLYGPQFSEHPLSVLFTPHADIADDDVVGVIEELHKCNPYAIDVMNEFVGQGLGIHSDRCMVIVSNKEAFEEKTGHRGTSRCMIPTSSGWELSRHMLSHQDGIYSMNCCSIWVSRIETDKGVRVSSDDLRRLVQNMVLSRDLIMELRLFKMINPCWMQQMGWLNTRFTKNGRDVLVKVKRDILWKQRNSKRMLDRLFEPRFGCLSLQEEFFVRRPIILVKRFFAKVARHYKARVVKEKVRLAKIRAFTRKRAKGTRKRVRLKKWAASIHALQRAKEENAARRWSGLVRAALEEERDKRKAVLMRWSFRVKRAAKTVVKFMVDTYYCARIRRNLCLVAFKARVIQAYWRRFKARRTFKWAVTTLVECLRKRKVQRRMYRIEMEARRTMAVQQHREMGLQMQAKRELMMRSVEAISPALNHLFSPKNLAKDVFLLRLVQPHMSDPSVGIVPYTSLCTPAFQSIYSHVLHAATPDEAWDMVRAAAEQASNTWGDMCGVGINFYHPAFLNVSMRGTAEWMHSRESGLPKEVGPSVEINQ
jgi:hypothetical protein